MTNLIRLTLPMAAALLVAAAPAAASSLHVTQAHGDITISTRQDPGVYRTTVLVPAAFWLHRSAHVAGGATVQVATATGPVTFVGWIQNATPLDYAIDDCAADVGYAHQAVWLLVLRQSNGIAAAQIPIFVDAGPHGTTALTWCASRAADMNVTSVKFTLDPVFSAPVQHGTYRWQAEFDSGKTADAFATMQQ
jgi:hypothetical protein